MHDSNGNELNIGDIVERVACSTSSMKIGEIGTITGFDNDGSFMSLKEYSKSKECTFSPRYYKLVSQKQTHNLTLIL